MSIFNKQFEEVAFEDIENLVSQKMIESQKLEFKKIAWPRNDEGGKEMLKDITSMANTYGGYIIIGVDEDADGNANQINNVTDAELERDRITSLCLSCIEPRIAGLKISCLKKDETSVILIYAPSSLRAPHLVTKGVGQFWCRHDRQKSKMSVEEVRDKFFKNYNFIENTQKFLDNRHELVMRDIGGEPTLVLKAVPIDTRNEFVDIKDKELREKMLHQDGARSGGWTLNFSTSSVEPSFYGLKISEQQKRQLELHRNGYLEVIIRTQFTRENRINEVNNGGNNTKLIKFLDPIAIIEYIYSFIKQLDKISSHLNYDGQYSVGFCLYNIAEYPLLPYPCQNNILSDFYNLKPYPGKNIDLGLFSFDDINADKISKFLADRIWQSFGFEEAPLFKDGKFTLYTS